MSPEALLEIEEKAQDLIDLSEMRALVDDICRVDVSGWTDEHFALLENIIKRAIAVLKTISNKAHEPLIARLEIAREGVEQGMSPDPAKRPSLDDMRAFVAAHL